MSLLHSGSESESPTRNSEEPIIKIKVTASNNGNNATISIITIITYSKHTTNIFNLF